MEHRIDTALPYAALRFDNCELLVPQGEIHTLEPVLDVDRTTELPDAAGTLMVDGKARPIYCLDREFTAMPEIPPNRRVCVLLNAGEGRYFGLLCDDVESLSLASAHLHPVPTCMANPKLPILGLFVHQNGLSSVTASTRLATYLLPLEPTHG